jgi:alkanesulfonate monooxygenase SsuD/methylene tetrahydromethanopterin reductase-like flavin-dependent oxidoreductase (luciferase family)
VPSPTPAVGGAPARPRVGGPLGLILPTFPQGRPAPPDGSELAEGCRRAEAAGAAALWACDHLFWHSPSLECLSAVTVAATATTRPAVGSCVLQLPLRNAPSVAKQAASIQHLSGGRLVLGVGIGNHPGEYEAAGMRFDGRGRALEEGMAAMRSAWEADRPPSHYAQLPVPSRIPIWVGGSSEAALRRAATVGDGWIPLFLSPRMYSAAVERLDKESERAQRDPAEVSRAIVVFVAVGGSAAQERSLEWMGGLYGLAPEKFRRHVIAADARSVAASVSEFLDAGAQHVALFVTSDSPLAEFEDVSEALDDIREHSARP